MYSVQRDPQVSWASYFWLLTESLVFQDQTKSSISSDESQNSKSKMAASMKNVDLGFVEKTDSWRLSSCFFPCKVGGKPAWLSLKPVPSVEDVTCGECGKPCVFLLQIYAPVDDVKSCFHRTLFLFVCREASCCQRNVANNVRVLRSQLSRENDFYSSEPLHDSSPA